MASRCSKCGRQDNVKIHAESQVLANKELSDVKLTDLKSGYFDLKIESERAVNGFVYVDIAHTTLSKSQVDKLKLCLSL